MGLFLWDQTVIRKSVEGFECLISGESSLAQKGLRGRCRGTYKRHFDA